MLRTLLLALLLALVPCGAQVIPIENAIQAPTYAPPAASSNPGRWTFQEDKQKHAAAGIIVGVYVTHYVQQQGWEHPRVWGTLAALAVGLLKEAHDKGRGGPFSVEDAAYTMAGGAVGSLVYRW